MKHDRIIDELSEAFGSQGELGKAFGVNNSTVCHWRQNGIPARHWPRVMEVAERVGLPLTLTELATNWPPNRRPKRLTAAA